jgi:PleD family two-component response regulator
MRLAIINAAIPHAKSSAANVVSISAGVAGGNINSMLDVQDLIKLADSALYKTKSKGRNQV